MKSIETKVIKIESLNDEEKLAEAAEILRSGGLAAVPTETVYGLAANIYNNDAVEKIFKAKGRPQDNPLIVHVSEASEIEPLVREFPEKVRRLFEAFAPGPITAVLPKSSLISDLVSGGLDSVAVRIPEHEITRAIIKKIGAPLAAPSANISGKPSPISAQDVLDDLDGRIDAVVDGGGCKVGVESTVVSFTGEKPVLLRPGGVTIPQLKSIIGEVEIHPAVYSQLDSEINASSPGMKYKHYAPSVKLVVVKSSFHKFKKFISSIKGENFAVLCFEGEDKLLNAVCRVYGERLNPLTQARALYDSLRALDELGADVVYARRPSTKGLGLAVYNRLMRAAGFNCIDLSADPLVIGLTGPTGSGKTAICEELRARGFNILDADSAARRVSAPGTETLRKLEERFGKRIISSDGSLIRSELAKAAFSSKAGSEALNSITHPAILKEIEKDMDFLTDKGVKYLVMDAPLLFESEADLYCDFSVAILAAPDIRLRRILSRDSIDLEMAKLRMNAQQNDVYYSERADLTLRNDFGNVKDLADNIINYIETGA